MRIRISSLIFWWRSTCLSRGECRVIPWVRTLRASISVVVCKDILHCSDISPRKFGEVCIDAVVSVYFDNREFGPLGLPMLPASLSISGLSARLIILPVPFSIARYSLLCAGKVCMNYLASCVRDRGEHSRSHLLLIWRNKVPTAFAW